MNIKRYIDVAIRREIRRWADDVDIKKLMMLKESGRKKLKKAKQKIASELPEISSLIEKYDFLSQANLMTKKRNPRLNELVRRAMELEWAIEPSGPYQKNPTDQQYEDLKKAINALKV